MKIIKYIALVFAVIAGVWACDDEFEPNIPQGRVEEVSFERDTFIFGESAGKVEVPVIAAKYVNYATQIKVKVINGTALEDSNFVVSEKELKMPLGSAQVNVELKIIDDTVINESRSFRMELESISGGGIPAATRQSCVVIIRNDDYIPEATIMFDREKDTIQEDGGVLHVPFHLTMAAEGDVTVTFAQAVRGGQTAKQGMHFDFAERVNTVTLPQGTLEGEIALNIINNELPEGDVHFYLAVREVQGALLGADSLCHITIVEDDLDRILRFGKPAGDGLYHEESGQLEIPLIFEGGRSAERLVCGKIALDSLFNCTADDVTLLTQSFTTAGDSTVKVLVKVKDNEDFGEWGFKLVLSDLKNVRAVSRDARIDVKDDEREFGFAQTEWEVSEGENLNMEIAVKGGAALMDLPWTLEVVEGETTAEQVQYELPSSFVRIVAGQTKGTFTLKTFRHDSRNDRVLKLRLVLLNNVGTSSPKKVLMKDEVCTVTIKNTDASIGFGEQKMNAWLVKEEVEVPVVLADISKTAMVYFQPKGGDAKGIEFSIEGIPYTGEPIPVVFQDGISKNIKVKIESVTDPLNGEPLELEIASVGGDGATNDDIDPETRTTKLDYYEATANKLLELAGVYSMRIYRQDGSNIVYDTWNITVEHEGKGKVVATFDKYIHNNQAWENGYSKMDYDFQSGTFRIRLGVEVGVDGGNGYTYGIKDSGNGGSYGTTLPMVVDIDWNNNKLLWNTDGTEDGNHLKVSNADLRWGICYYKEGTAPSVANSNTNIKCFQMTKN